MARNVAVVEGMRGPQNSREDQRADGPQQRGDDGVSLVGANKKNEKVFVSRYGGLRVQVTAPADRIDPLTGRMTQARPKVAQFVGGVFKTSDPDTIEWLTHHRNFGLKGGTFWLAEEAQRAGEEKRYADMVKMVKANPALADRLLGDLTKDEFPLEKLASPAEESTHA